MDSLSKRELETHVPVVGWLQIVNGLLGILWGALLYLWLGSFNVDTLLGTRWGQIILVAFVLAVITFAIGMLFVVRSSRKVLGHLQEEACTHMEEVGGLQRTMNSSQIVVLLLGIVVIALMVMASQRV